MGTPKILRKLTALSLSVILLFGCTSGLFSAYAAEHPKNIIQNLSCQKKSADNLDSQNAELRFSFEIDSLDFLSAGIVFSLSESDPRINKSKCSKYEAQTVYETIWANGKEIYPERGNYFVAVKLSSIPHAKFGSLIYLRAFVENENGIIYSDAKAVDITYMLDPEHCHIISDPSSTINASIVNEKCKIGTCDICDIDNVREYAGKGTFFVACATDKTNFSGKNWQLSQAITDKVFCPTEENPNGNDLLIEYSICWNAFAENSSSYYSKGLLQVQLKTNKIKPIATIQTLNFNDNFSNSVAKTAGSLEYGDFSSYTEESPLKTGDSTHGTATDFPLISDYGWHRIQIRVHQTATLTGESTVSYSFVVSYYVDGVLSMQYNTNPIDSALLLYTATAENGQLSFSQNVGTERNVIIVMNGMSTAGDFYLPIGDFSVTAGTEFSKIVRPAKNCDEETFEKNDKTFPATEYYEIDNNSTCLSNHSNETEYFYYETIPTAEKNGVKAYVCSTCGKIRYETATLAQYNLDTAE